LHYDSGYSKANIEQFFELPNKRIFGTTFYIQVYLISYKKMTNVLIVDAERVIRSTLKERLEYEGYVVDTAQSRSEATGKLERSAFDVMLCDISLPEKRCVGPPFGRT
jgi:PleD family two-component response regulator